MVLRRVYQSGAIMSDEKAVYWMSQVVGWFGFIVLILFQNLISGHVDMGIFKVLVVNFVLGIGLSHLMRYVIVRSGMLNLKIYSLVPRLILLSVITGAVAALSYAVISDVFFADVGRILVWPYTLLVELVVPFITIFTFWNILYFAAIFLKNYEREEIKNLRLTASVNEAELNALRAQMNPHFMFNALNGIRALITENPEHAKKSITRLSNILRSSLASTKTRFVTVQEEMAIVRDYLELEKIRYEERLTYAIDISPEVQRVRIPPLLVQTLVENAIKHGISNLAEGGEVRIIAHPCDEGICLRVINTGQLVDERPEIREEGGIGILNSERRLKLLYGDRASVHLFSQNDTVVCEVIIPILKTNIDHPKSITE